MLALSPLSVKYGEASMIEELAVMQEIETILTERIEDGKLKVQQFGVPKGFSAEEIRQILRNYGDSYNWAKIKENRYNSGIILFDGTASRDDETILKDKFSKIEEKINGSFEFSSENSVSQEQIVNDVFSYENGREYRIIFSGNVEISEEDALKLVFLKGKLKTSEDPSSVNFQQAEVLQDKSGIDQNKLVKKLILG